MAQHPIMPLATDALIGDTTHLTAQEFGCYLLILIATWRNNGCPLPDDGVRLARICRTSFNQFSTKIRPRLIEFFDISDGYWHQKRLETTWSFVKKRRESQSANGKLSALKRKEMRSTTVPTNLQPPNPLSKEVSKKDSDSAGAESAAASAAPDPIKALFDRGVRVLAEEGISAQRARSMLGKWRSEFGDAAVMGAIVATENDPSVSEPVSFIVGCLNNSKRGQRTNGKRLSPADTLYLGASEVGEELERRELERNRHSSRRPFGSLLDR